MGLAQPILNVPLVEAGMKLASLVMTTKLQAVPGASIQVEEWDNPQHITQSLLV